MLLGNFNYTLMLKAVYQSFFFHILVMFLKLGLYIVVLLFAVGCTVVLAAYGKLLSKQHRTLGGTMPEKVSNVQALKSGPNQRFAKDDQVYIITIFFYLYSEYNLNLRFCCHNFFYVSVIRNIK